MKLDFIHLLPEGFVPESRVWIYQSPRLFSMGEALQIEDQLNAFTESWTSHGADVQAAGLLLFGQFLVLIAEESRAGVSGCSTDASVRFVKELGAQYGVDFFDRLTLAFIKGDKVERIPLSQLSYAVEHGFVSGDTLYFNNTVGTLGELRTQWIVPAAESWLGRKLKAA